MTICTRPRNLRVPEIQARQQFTGEVRAAGGARGRGAGGARGVAGEGQTVEWVEEDRVGRVIYLEFPIACWAGLHLNFRLECNSGPRGPPAGGLETHPRPA